MVAYSHGFNSMWIPAKRVIVSLQVGCPEGRIEENVSKLTAAGYKVGSHLPLSSQIAWVETVKSKMTSTSD